MYKQLLQDIKNGCHLKKLKNRTNFYENLYAAEPTDNVLADEQLTDLDIKTLSQGKTASLEEPITCQDLCNTVKQMKNN